MFSMQCPFKDTSTGIKMCVQYMSMCVWISLSVPVCVVTISGICSPMSVHTKKRHLFSTRHCKHSITTERHLSVDPAHMLCNTGNLFSKTRHDGVCVCACVRACSQCFYTYMSEKREYVWFGTADGSVLMQEIKIRCLLLQPNGRYKNVLKMYWTNLVIFIQYSVRASLCINFACSLKKRIQLIKSWNNSNNN